MFDGGQTMISAKLERLVLRDSVVLLYKRSFYDTHRLDFISALEHSGAQWCYSTSTNMPKL